MADNATVVSTSTLNFPNRLGKGRLPFTEFGAKLVVQEYRALNDRLTNAILWLLFILV